MPRGFKTEDGPRPDFAELYEATEHWSADYPPRTRRNVEDSDATLYFSTTESPGFYATRKAARELGKPFLSVAGVIDWVPTHHVIRWLREHDVRVLNVAGSRASRDPGLGRLVEDWLGRLFRELGFREVTCD